MSFEAPKLKINIFPKQFALCVNMFSNLLSGFCRVDMQTMNQRHKKVFQIEYCKC